MTRKQIEDQLADAKGEINQIELQLTLAVDKRIGKKTGQQLAADRRRAKKRVKELERWLASGLFEGRGGVRLANPSGGVR